MDDNKTTMFEPEQLPTPSSPSLQRSDTMASQKSIHRNDRAGLARDLVENIIPELLRTSPRARHGIHKSEVIDSPPSQREDSPSIDDTRHTLTIRIKDVDTLTAARQMSYSSRRASMSTTRRATEVAPRRVPNVCVLNQASATKPGSGFLDGVHSQEESLCRRSTLYASLWDRLYPLPQIGGIFSPDVLVFNDSTPEAAELSKRDRAYVDVISASMIRFPGPHKWQDPRERARHDCSCGVSYCATHQELVWEKMTAVLRMAQMNGAEKLVLGVWGCGLYGHPSYEIARAWKRVLFGTKKRPASWPGIKEVVFAVTERPWLRDFEKIFADVASGTSNEYVPDSPPAERTEEDEAEHTARIQDIVNEIAEAETRLSQLSSAKMRGEQKDRIAVLSQRLTEVGRKENLEDEEDEPRGEEQLVDGFVLSGYAISDVGEDNSYYNFDENDVASSSSLTPASAYEFKLEQPEEAVRHSRTDSSGTGSYAILQPSEMDSPVGRPVRVNSFEQDVADRRRLDESNGWFNGSVNQLSALVRKTGGHNPAMSPAEPRPDDLSFPGY